MHLLQCVPRNFVSFYITHLSHDLKGAITVFEKLFLKVIDQPKLSMVYSQGRGLFVTALHFLPPPPPPQAVTFYFKLDCFDDVLFPGGGGPRGRVKQVI